MEKYKKNHLLFLKNFAIPYDDNMSESDYSGRSAHALKRVQRTGIAVQQSSAAVQPRPLGMG